MLNPYLKIVLLTFLTFFAAAHANAKFFDDFDDIVLETTEIQILYTNELNEEVVISVPFESPINLSLNDFDANALNDLVPLDPGQYDQIRLVINAASETLDSIVLISEEAFSAFSQQGIVKLVGGFIVDEETGLADFSLVLKKVIHEPKGKSQDFRLKPTIKMIDNLSEDDEEEEEEEEE